jgi:hypothetical protein
VIASSRFIVSTDDEQLPTLVVALLTNTAASSSGIIFMHAGSA